MSNPITFHNTVKKYGDNTVISDLSLKVNSGEFFTLLGPSGCGKTTLLRMVAGFNSIEGGEIRFGDRVINAIPPEKRNIGMVFQNYAIFPHMTVESNVAFGLKNRKVPKEEISRRVDEILKKVHIDNLRDRLPQNMSGGQQQRVALARAIVIEPDVLLMDEPLSNLDAKLRVEMRDAIREIQHAVGITTIYVTHDQEEALAISDRIGVMYKGVLQHVGTPRNIYLRPANQFVAGFIGKSNFLPVTGTEDGVKNLLHFDGYTAEIQNLEDNIPFGGKLVAAVRPEEFEIHSSAPGIKGVVRDCVFLGLNMHYFVELSDGMLIETIAPADIENEIKRGSTVYLTVKTNRINVYTENGERNMVRGVKNDAEV